VASPRIGISLGLDVEGALRTGRSTHYLDTRYTDAVRDAGGSPRLLAAGAAAEELIGEVDALLIPGGDDFLPEDPYRDGVSFQPVATIQLAFDRSLVRSALAAGVPILGICYGMQLLALESGGRLYHHLPLDLPGAGDHGAAGRNVRHRVSIEQESRLGRILAAERVTIDSRHHQAVADPGHLHVSARAEDGVIEAVETADKAAPLLLGVQWHPESMEGEHPKRLFRALIEAASPRPKRAPETGTDLKLERIPEH
jgi:putative glutamine amidotransferase